MVLSSDRVEEVEVDEYLRAHRRSPKDVKAEIELKINQDVTQLCKELEIEITAEELIELEKEFSVYAVLYALKTYPTMYREYLKDPTGFPNIAAQDALFEYNHR